MPGHESARHCRRPRGPAPPRSTWCIVDRDVADRRLRPPGFSPAWACAVADGRRTACDRCRRAWRRREPTRVGAQAFRFHPRIAAPNSRSVVGSGVSGCPGAVPIHERIRGLHERLGRLRPNPHSGRSRDHSRLHRRERRGSRRVAPAGRRMRDGQLCRRASSQGRRARCGGREPVDARRRPSEARWRAGVSGRPARGGHRCAAVRGCELRRGDGEPGAAPPPGLAGGRLGPSCGGFSGSLRGCCARAVR